MSPGALDPLLWSVGIAVPVAAVATEVVWRVARPLAPAARVAVASLAPVGLAAILSIPVSLHSSHLSTTTLGVVVVSAALQGLLLPVLLLLSRKA